MPKNLVRTGLVDGMAAAPLATAASSNPLLTTLLTYQVAPGTANASVYLIDTVLMPPTA